MNKIMIYNNFITENAVYAGLPVINNSHTYTSDNDQSL